MFPIQRNNRLPLRTIVILIAASSSLTMLLFVAVQYKKFQDELLPDGNQGNDRYSSHYGSMAIYYTKPHMDSHMD